MPGNAGLTWLSRITTKTSKQNNGQNGQNEWCSQCELGAAEEEIQGDLPTDETVWV